MKQSIPKIPPEAELVDLPKAAEILTDRAGQGWSLSSLRRLLDNEWANYEGQIWVNRSTTGRNRRIKIYIEGALHWLRLPANQR